MFKCSENKNKYFCTKRSIAQIILCSFFIIFKKVIFLYHMVRLSQWIGSVLNKFEKPCCHLANKIHYQSCAAITSSCSVRGKIQCLHQLLKRQKDHCMGSWGSKESQKKKNHKKIPSPSYISVSQHPHAHTEKTSWLHPLSPSFTVSSSSS